MESGVRLVQDWLTLRGPGAATAVMVVDDYLNLLPWASNPDREAINRLHIS